MMRGSHGPIRQLQDLNWGAFDHASHAPQLSVTITYVFKPFMHCVLLDVAQVTSDRIFSNTE